MTRPKTLAWGGLEGARHAAKYVLQTITLGDSLRLDKPFDAYLPGTHFRPLSLYTDDKGRNYTVGLFDDSRVVDVPNNKIFRDVKKFDKTNREKAIEWERETQAMLFADGLSDIQTTAGSNSRDRDLRFCINDIVFYAEAKVKLNVGKMGVLALIAENDRWIPSPKAMYNGAFQDQLLSTRIEGVPFLEYFNEVRPAKGFNKHVKKEDGGLINWSHPLSKDDSFKLAHAYFLEKDVDLLHIGYGHGTFRVGKSHDTDRLLTGLPTIENIRCTLSVGQSGISRPVEVAIRPKMRNSLDKSHLDLTLPEHRQEFKERIIHGKASGAYT